MSRLVICNWMTRALKTYWIDGLGPLGSECKDFLPILGLVRTKGTFTQNVFFHYNALLFHCFSKT